MDVHYEPARILSGDLWYWHYVGKNQKKIFLIAVDIQGKGVGAALPTVAFASLLKEFLSSQSEKLESLQPILAFIQEKIMTTEALTKKAAACISYLIDTEKKTFEYSNAGMEEVVTFVHDSKIRILPCLSSAFGFEEDPVPTQLYSYELGDRLLLSSDGLKDTVNPDGIRFGESNLNELIHTALAKPIDAVLSTILEPVQKYQATAEQTDDRTIMLIEFI